MDNEYLTETLSEISQNINLLIHQVAKAEHQNTGNPPPAEPEPERLSVQFSQQLLKELDTLFEPVNLLKVWLSYSRGKMPASVYDVAAQLIADTAHRYCSLRGKIDPNDLPF